MDILHDKSEQLHSSTPLIDLGRQLDLASHLSDQEFADRYNMPVGSVELFKKRNVTSDEEFPNASAVLEIGSQPDVNTSCYQVESKDGELFVVTNQDSSNNWHMFTSRNGATWSQAPNLESEAAEFTGARYQDREIDTFDLRLKPNPSTESDAQLLGRLFVRVANGNSVLVRALPVQEVCNAMGIEKMSPISPDSKYYPDIPYNVMKQYVK